MFCGIFLKHFCSLPWRRTGRQPTGTRAQKARRPCYLARGAAMADELARGPGSDTGQQEMGGGGRTLATAGELATTGADRRGGGGAGLGSE
jgi:hypothetical protein